MGSDQDTQGNPPPQAEAAFASFLTLREKDKNVDFDSFCAVRPEVAGLPTVGGLFNPSLEGAVALEPDLVVLVPGAQQRDFRRRLEGLGIEVLSLPNITIEEVLASIETLGARVGRSDAASQRLAEIRAAFAVAERAAAGRPRPRTVLVLQRDPLFVVGRGSFLDAMLTAAGAENLGAALSQPYPRAGIEWLIASAPEVILDASDDPQPPGPHWARWPSLPAVAASRVVAIPTDDVVRPGPYLDRGLARLVAALAGAYPP